MSIMNNSKADLTSTEIEAKLVEFDKRIDALKQAYEMYFNGMEKLPPTSMRKEVVRLMRELEHRTFIRNTAQKFRLRSLIQRFTTYKHNWDRILRSIENGTYIRDIQKARRNIARHEAADQRAAARESSAIELDLDFDAIDNLDMFAQEIGSAMLNPPAAPAMAAKPERAPSLPPSGSSPGVPSADDMRARKIMELQAKLGLPATGAVQDAAPAAAPAYAPAPSAAPQDADPRQSKLDEMRRRLAARGQAQVAPGSEQIDPSQVRGASQDKLQRLREDRERMERHRQSIQRGNAQPAAAQPQRPQPQGGGEDEGVRRVYRNLVEAKRRCNESTNNLSYESVARSMSQQRERLRQSHGARDVDFKVVIKDGRAFLKPEPK